MSVKHIHRPRKVFERLREQEKEKEKETEKEREKKEIEIQRDREICIQSSPSSSFSILHKKLEVLSQSFIEMLARYRATSHVSSLPVIARQS